jgi:hypothetical protein
MVFEKSLRVDCIQKQVLVNGPLFGVSSQILCLPEFRLGCFVASSAFVLMCLWKLGSESGGMRMARIEEKNIKRSFGAAYGSLV